MACFTRVQWRTPATRCTRSIPPPARSSGAFPREDQLSQGPRWLMARCTGDPDTREPAASATTVSTPSALEGGELTAATAAISSTTTPCRGAPGREALASARCRIWGSRRERQRVREERKHLRFDAL